MLKWLVSFPVLAVLVPEMSPEAVRVFSAGIATTMFVLTPPLFFTGVALALVRRNDL